MGEHVLTDLQRKKLTGYFRLYDVNGDNRTGPEDFDRVVENVRILHDLATYSPRHEALRDGFRRRWESLRTSADADHDGSVDLAEWLGYWDHVIETPELYEAEVNTLAAQLFETFDKDEDGVLGADEFCDFYGVYGLPSALARRVFLDLDVDGDAVISEVELMNMVHEFYRSTDPNAPGNQLFGPVE
jgi:juvenile hormone diol kinase